jgi:hypothetical protein
MCACLLHMMTLAPPLPRIPTYPLSTVGQLVFEEGTEATLCTGTLIGTNAVLTAAHCIFNRNAKVRLGGPLPKQVPIKEFESRQVTDGKH